MKLIWDPYGGMYNSYACTTELVASDSSSGKPCAKPPGAAVVGSGMALYGLFRLPRTYISLEEKTH